MYKQIFNLKTICLLAATLMLSPGISHAGWFADKPVQKAKAKVTARVSNAAHQAQDRVTAMADKINEIYAQFEEGRPLINAMKDSQMVDMTKEVMLYLQEAQQDYQHFASSGVYGFEGDVNDLLDDMGDIGRKVKLGNGLEEKLDKVRNLLAKMPTQFLFVMHKATGKGVTELRGQTQVLNTQLSVVERLPSAHDLFTAPMNYRNELCPLVNYPEEKVKLAVVMAIVKRLELFAGLLNDASPDDLHVSATAVAGGGTTVSKFPTKGITLIIKHVVGSVKVYLENTKVIAEAVCQ